MKSKKQFICETMTVVPFIAFTLVWLVLGLGFNMDFSPSGSYGASMFYNLILPLLIVGIGSVIYAIILVVETVKSEGKSLGEKIIYGVIAWLITCNLFFLVYLYRSIMFFSKKKRCE